MIMSVRSFSKDLRALSGVLFRLLIHPVFAVIFVFASLGHRSVILAPDGIILKEITPLLKDRIFPLSRPLPSGPFPIPPGPDP